MRRLPMKMLPLLLAAGALGTMVAVHAQQREKEGGDGDPPRAVFTDRDVFLLAGAEMIAGPEITGIHRAPAGRWVLAVRMRREMTDLLSSVLGEETHGEASLLLWDSRTRRTVLLWRQPFGAAQAGLVEKVHWLPRSERALVVVRVAGTLPDGGTGVRRSLLLVDAASPRGYPLPRVLATLADGEDLMVSPMQPLAVLRRVEEEGESLRIIGPNGGVGVAIPAPEAAFHSESGRRTAISCIWRS